jgi:hypothetical protein
MTKTSTLPLAGCLLLCVPGISACSDSDDDLPVGPCNGDTFGGEDEVGLSGSDASELELSAGLNPKGPVDELRPPRPELEEGWIEAPGLDGFYRYATIHELRRLNWPQHTLLLATPFGILDEGEGTAAGQAWIELPTWQADREIWVTSIQNQVVFERQEFYRVQTLALGHFVEHHNAVDGSSALEVRHPTFTLYGAEQRESVGQVLTDSSGALLLRRQTPEGSVQLTAPHASRRLDVPPPSGFQVAVVSPSEQGITRGPLIPFSCENGVCEDPDDPLDECNDGIDNDGDGYGDLCDWNCLPHSDFGAHHFPEARSRVENGKNYALMGGGDICTELGETWMVTFADWALQASEFLNQIRPGENDAVHYRIFSCWVFEDNEAFNGCQHGIQYMNGEPVGVGDPVCPSGMEDYPYQTSENDPHPGLLLYDEATDGAWRDLELNTVELGPYGEPVNGTGFLTSDTTATCKATVCNPVAGLASLSPHNDIWDLGRFVVTNANPDDWHTLAHETGHTLGMLHDNYVDGFMNTEDNNFGLLPKLGISVDEDYPDMDNNETWELSFARKHSHPRSSGWRWTGCYEVDHVCAPLGKPGWSCEAAWCEPD